MENTSENSQTNESSFVENDEGMITAVDVPINRHQSSSITVEDNEFPVIGNEFLIRKLSKIEFFFSERGIKGTVVSINRFKHFGFIKR